MVLEKLVIQAFGPFKDKVEIDFAKEDIDRGLVLVTGDTGAGKTTIFDAITFSLYGRTSSSVRDAKSLRSDFADPGAETYVHLEFLHAGKKYSVTRNPEYLRASKRGDGLVKENAGASLDLAGRAVTGTNNVDKEIEELLGLSFQQFSQISLLAQGEVTKFLLASTEEKANIFRKIFATDAYKHLGDLLKEKEKNANKKYIELQNKIASQIDRITFLEKEEIDCMQNADIVTKLEEKVLENAELCKKLEEALAEKQKLVTQKEAKLSRIQEDNRKIQEYIDTCKEEENLAKEKANIEEKEKVCEYAKKTRDISSCLLQKETARENAKKEETKYIDAKEKVDTFAKKLEERKDAFSKIATYPSLQEKKAEEISSLEKRKENILQKNTLEKEIEILENNIQEKIRKMQEVLDTYVEMQKEYYLQEAAILAEKLKEGMPCMVCGSKVHPQKATRKNTSVTKEILEEKEKILEASKAKIHTEKGILEAKEKERKNIPEETLSLEKILEEITALEEEKENMQKEYTSLLEEKDILEREYTSSKEKEKSSKENLDAFLQKEKEEEEKLQELFVKANTNMQEYIAKKVTQEVEEEMLAAITSYRENIAAISARKSVLEKDVKGKEIVDVTVEEEMLKQMQEEYAKENAVFVDNKTVVKEQEATLHVLAKYIEENVSVEEEYATLKRLADTAQGSLSGREKVPFEMYVQSYYLKHVLAEANKRLAKMTDGRYNMVQGTNTSKKGKSGLDFAVLDAYTGKERDVSTLSGGEKFKASLALALGMSDVISNFAGGIKTDILFVDEGFGSLDTESLSQALDVLSNLVNANKFIGVISHVPELKTRIDKKILVRKNNNGSYIEIEN